ncbi:MAG: KEOPS complex subunit Pcc1 [Candidatus Aenigmarchaeota archaeon]|nr:KEOPS complex subunit Pcc1 [Candidatus Aenigmarchaeota archaeon]
MKAEIIIDCKDPEIIIKSIKPDMDVNGKFDVELKKEKNALKLVVESKDMSGLLAAINSYLKMIKTLKELEEM